LSPGLGGLAFVGPTAPYTFFGVGAVQSHGHFAMVYLIAMVAVSFTAASYGKMASAFPEAGSGSKAIHPVVGYLAEWVTILDYILMPRPSRQGIVSKRVRKLCGHAR
jgi:putrescine importer